MELIISIVVIILIVLKRNETERSMCSETSWLSPYETEFHPLTSRQTSLKPSEC